MEEVAIMMPSVVNNDELSDETESINLDLHVSDTEDSTESLKKCDNENNDQTESEEDILNKYVDDVSNENIKKSEQNDKPDSKPTLLNGAVAKKTESYSNCNGISTSSDDAVEDNDLDEVSVNKRDDKNLEETLLNKKDVEGTVIENSTTQNTTKDDQKSKIDHKAVAREETEYKCEKKDLNEENCTKTEIEEASNNQIRSDKNEDGESTTNIEEKVCEETENSCKVTKGNSEKGKTVSTPVEETSGKKQNETKTDDNEDNDDLLCVMDEKTVDEANENKDENSCSASEKDDEAKDSEENIDENNEENADETKEEETEENNESQMEMDMDASECAMDIEESDIGGVVYTDQNRDIRNEETDNSENKMETDKDANKENEHTDDITVTDAVVKDNSFPENSLINGTLKEAVKDDVISQGGNEEVDKETPKKSTKRQLSDSSDSESAKKIKLQTVDDEKPPEKEKRPVVILGSFKKFMLDKKLKKLTRLELEELCMQKMCECIVNKSEIGELRQKIMIQEQTIDTWRKEAIVVAKQTRDLKIVHERLMADLKAMKEQTGKPLVPVKITRSVGLQAIIENPSRLRTSAAMNGPTTPQQRSPVANGNQQPNKSVPPSTPQTRPPIKPKVQPQRVNSNSRPLQPIAQKDNVNNSKPRQTLSSQQTKKNTEPKAVIDLTDEDEKNQNAKQTTNTASPTVRILNKQNLNITSKSASNTPNSQASKIMFVSPNVLQRNSAVMVKMNSNGLVNPPNGLTTLPNGQVSVVTTPVVRTVSQVRVPVSSVTTVRTAASTKQQIYKHPAPLPAAPSYQTNMSGKKPIPPKPHLNLTRSNCGTGIVLQWKMPYKLESYETIVSYQLYAYQETKSPPKTDNWGKIGDVKALELPMAVTLTQFAVGNRYFFAVRAVDEQKRLGPFSDPENILL